MARVGWLCTEGLRGYISVFPLSLAPSFYELNPPASSFASGSNLPGEGLLEPIFA